MDLSSLQATLRQLSALKDFLEKVDHHTQGAVLHLRAAEASVAGLPHHALAKSHRAQLQNSINHLVGLTTTLEHTDVRLIPLMANLRRTIRLLGGEYASHTDGLSFPLKSQEVPYRFTNLDDFEQALSLSIEQAGLDRLNDARGRAIQVRVLPTFTLL